jgi:alpha-beta hydrolase superfamily lysophospholipase
MAIEEKQFRLQGTDGASIAAYRWAARGVTPRAVLQVAHGMAEHARRYVEPLTPLMEAGWVVYADDHRGHGLTAPGPEALGDFGFDGAERVIEDLGLLTDLARRENPGLPLVMLAHSLGSFFAQAYVFDRSADIDAMVYSGTAAFGDKAARGLNSSFRGGDEPRTPYDWLSRDEAVVDAYIADPLCGFGRKKTAADSFRRVQDRLPDPSEIGKIRKDLPVYIFVGDQDPIHRDLTLLPPLVDGYRDAGVTDVTLKVYPGGSHEMLNEINRDEVVSDLTAWLERVAGARAA